MNAWTKLHITCQTCPMKNVDVFNLAKTLFTQPCSAEVNIRHQTWKLVKHLRRKTPKSIQLASCASPDNASCLAEYARNAAVLEVYYQQLNYESLNEVPVYPVWNFKKHDVKTFWNIQISSLLADVGGCVSLWLGASILTAAEFIAIIAQLIALICGNVKRKKQKPVDAEVCFVWNSKPFPIL